MQATVTGISLWSRWQRDRGLFFNSHFVEHPDGNCAIDPLPPDDDDAAEIAARGGLAWVVVTNRDHARDAAALAARFGAKIAASALEVPVPAGLAVDRTLSDGETIGGGRVIALEGLKTPGEFALYFPERETALVGDALWGAPAGSLRLMPDEKLADPARAALSLRRLAACRPKHLLVGDGASVFGEATAAIWRALESRSDCYVNKINLDELALAVEPAPAGTKRHFGEFAYADVDFAIGAERLGYGFVRMRPGATFCPMHWHTREEEMYVVLAGTATLATPRGETPLRARDVVAFPARRSGAHRVTATGTEPFEMLAIANVDAGDVCFYPDSRKLAVEATGTLVREQPQLSYFDGE